MFSKKSRLLTKILSDIEEKIGRFYTEEMIKDSVERALKDALESSIRSWIITNLDEKIQQSVQSFFQDQIDKISKNVSTAEFEESLKTAIEAKFKKVMMDQFNIHSTHRW